MVISHLSNSIRYVGRWDIRENAAVTTTPGAVLELAFWGKECVLLFDVNMNAEPYPHVYIQVDDGARVEARIEHYITVDGIATGEHTLKVIFKSAMEMQPRWHEPLVGKISFIGAEAEGEGVLLEDNRKLIEFIGDSITEGIWIDEERKPFNYYQQNMVYQNDSTATYAYLTAEALNMKPCIMGYGCIGITKGGNGGVPKACEAYPYYYSQRNIKDSNPDIIVINYGANDYLAKVEDYINGYEELLDIVRSLNPSAKIVVLSAFFGVYSEQLGKLVKEYNENKNESIAYIDASGWIPQYPIHPARDGHKLISEKLVQEFKKLGI